MKNIITVGGGTGSYTVLNGLKHLKDVSLTALVSMADDGGSTGVLRDELGVLPPGDVRQCLVALSESDEIVRDLMNYRFNGGSTLTGHSFGNIFLAALEKVTGSFAEGVEKASDILKIKGRVLPITHDSAKLRVELKNGKILEGETQIQEANLQTKGAEIKNIYYEGGNVTLDKHIEKPLLSADFIILGPGNYYCSVVPNLIVNGFKETLQKSNAKLIFPVNLTNKMEHTEGWKVSDYVKDIETYLSKKIDYILVNNDEPSKEQKEYYEKEEGKGVWVEDDLKDPRVMRAPMLSSVLFKGEYDEQFKAVRGFIRHDSHKLAACIGKLIRD